MNEKTHVKAIETIEKSGTTSEPIYNDPFYDEDLDDDTNYYPGSFISIQNECTTCKYFYRGCCTSPNDSCNYEPD